MSGYDLIAFDMDGTLLTSKNKVSESSREAIARAVELGKRIAVCTGRKLRDKVIRHSKVKVISNE